METKKDSFTKLTIVSTHERSGEVAMVPEKYYQRFSTIGYLICEYFFLAKSFTLENVKIEFSDFIHNPKEPGMVVIFTVNLQYLNEKFKVQAIWEEGENIITGEQYDEIEKKYNKRITLLFNEKTALNYDEKEKWEYDFHRVIIAILLSISESLKVDYEECKSGYESFNQHLKVLTRPKCFEKIFLDTYTK